MKNLTRPIGRCARLGLIALVAGTPAVVTAQSSATLLADIETAPEPFSSEPSRAVVLGSLQLFAATDLAHGRELWVKTAQGVSLLIDIFPGTAGSAPSDLVVFAGKVYFAATHPDHGRELWVSDGTAAGTKLLVDLEPGVVGTSPAELSVVGSDIYFHAARAKRGREPHVSDGTAAGTRLLLDLRPGPASSTDGAHHFRLCNGHILFCANDGVTGTELWRTDGTAAGTFQLKDLRVGVISGFNSREIPVVIGGKLLFNGFETRTGRELYASDGTTAGTGLLIDIRAGALNGDPKQFALFGNEVYFQATTTAEGAELWKTDGTTIGTRLVADVAPGSASSFPAGLRVLGNSLIFSASDGALGNELFVSDGSAQGTRLLADLVPGLASSFPSEIVVAGSFALIVADKVGAGRELWGSDGTTAGTKFLADLQPGSASSLPGEFSESVGGKVCFAATGPEGRELYETDGTPSGTRLVKDIEAVVGTRGSEPRDFTEVGPDRFYFVATTLANGTELYFFDGQQAQLIDVEVGARSSFPADLTVVGDSLYFVATRLSTGTELFRIRPGEQPSLVADLRPGTSSSSPRSLTVLDGKNLIFTANNGVAGTEVCTLTHGVPGVRVHDIAVGPATSSVGSFHVIHDPATGLENALFAATDAIVGRELFASDGLDVRLAFDFITGPAGSSPDKLAVSSDGTALLLTALDANGDLILRRVTGSERGPAGASVFIFYSEEELANFRRSFEVFAIFEILRKLRVPTRLVLANMQLRGSAGAANETYEVSPGDRFVPFRDIDIGTIEDSGDHTLVGDDFLVFHATTAGGGKELFIRDLNTGKFSSFDLVPGPESSNPRDFHVVGDRVVFTADTPSGGSSIFSTDGRTIVASTLPSSSSLSNSVISGQSVASFDPDARSGPQQAGPTGLELYGFGSLGASARPFGQPCNGRARIQVDSTRVGVNSKWTMLFGPSSNVRLVYLDASRPQPIRLGACELWTDPGQALLIAIGAAPSFSLTVPIPNDTKLVDVRVVLQALWLNPLTLLPLVPSQAMVLTLGR